MTSTLN